MGVFRSQDSFRKSFIILLLILVWISACSMERKRAFAPAPVLDESATAERPPDDLFAHFYYPDSPEEVARARYDLLMKQGTFEPLSDGRQTKRAPLPMWQSIGPYGAGDACPGLPTWKYSGRIISMERSFDNTSILYVGGAAGGLWRSTDGGASWANIFDDLPHPSVSTIAAHPIKDGHVWIGTGNKGNGESGPAAPSLGLVYRSEDNGDTWIPVVFETSTPITYVSRIVLLPQVGNQNVVFIATDQGVYKSSDYGALDSWTPVLPGEMSDLAFWANIFNTSFELVAADRLSNQLHRSTSGGDAGTWTALTLPGTSGIDLGRMTLAHSRLSAHRGIYASVAKTGDRTWWGIWRSVDFGSSWVQVTKPNPGVNQMDFNNAIAVDLNDQDRVYTGANWREVYLSTDGGTSWTATTGHATWRIHEDIHAIMAFGNQVFFANDGGIWKSTDYGNTIQDLGNLFLPLAETYTLTINPDATSLYSGDRYYIGTQDNGHSRGPNDFLGWQKLSCCDGGDIAFKDGIPYTSITFGVDTSVNRVQFPPGGDVCTTWQGFATGLAKGELWANRLIFDGTHFYTYLNNILYRANNGAQPWQPLRTAAAGVVAFGVAPEGFIVLGAQAADQVWTSDTNQANWIRSNTASFWGSKIMTDVVFGGTSSEGRRVFVSLSGVSGFRVAYSRDSGQSFVDITGDLPAQVNARRLTVDPENDRILYLGSDLGVWVSADRGGSWVPYSDGLPAVCYINDLEFDQQFNKVVAATYGRGVFLVDPYPALFADGFESGDTTAWSAVAKSY